MAPQDRLQEVSNHLNFPKGLLAGQVALITGAAQGIGKEIAKLFANEGAKVALSDIDAEKVKAAAEEIKASGGAAAAFPGDLLNDEYVSTLPTRVAETFGSKLHIIVNNAGFTYDGMIHKMTDKQWDTIVNLHGTAVFKLVKAAADYFRVTDGEPRNIINISSTSGVHGNVGQLNYAFAKAGVQGLTKTIAKEWARYGMRDCSCISDNLGVRANTVAFGSIETRLTAGKELGAFTTLSDGTRIALGIPQKQLEARAQGGFANIPLGRRGTATEAAAAVLAVASPLFSYVTGQTIMVTGGMNM